MAETAVSPPELRKRRPSLPDTDCDTFRNYVDSDRQGVVSAFYQEKNAKMTLQYTLDQIAAFEARPPKPMTVFDAMRLLDTVVDDSDPDTDAAQSVHAFQTAEALREKFPDEDWLHLTGFVHDLGKILATPEFGSLPQWAVVGDVFPLGVPFARENVFSQHFAANPDAANPAYSAGTGKYAANCGLRNVTMCWSHDEYMYRVLQRTPQCRLPEAARYIIRYHSFYPWHSAGAYTALCDDFDATMLAEVRRFQKCDLYSKLPTKPDPVALRPYYQALIDKYLPGELPF